MLENCRVNKGEKKDDEALARKIAALCDVYVNDAFGTAHRAEATTHGVARFAKVACAGPLMAAELDALGKALADPARPLVAIVAGSKVSTKLTILGELAKKVDSLIVGGGIANTFLLAAGKPIGKSLAERDLAGEAKRIIEEDRGAAADRRGGRQVAGRRQGQGEGGRRGGRRRDDPRHRPESAKALAAALKKAGTIVWNGPVGVFEKEPFAKGTEALAKAIAGSKAFSIAGGGDTVAAIHKFRIDKRIGYISTARRRIPGVSRRKEAARRGCARSPRGWLSSSASTPRARGCMRSLLKSARWCARPGSTKGCARSSCANLGQPRHPGERRPDGETRSRALAEPAGARRRSLLQPRCRRAGRHAVAPQGGIDGDVAVHSDCEGKLALGTWQGIYLWEHRRRGSRATSWCTSALEGFV